MLNFFDDAETRKFARHPVNFSAGLFPAGEEQLHQHCCHFEGSENP
jgi:hypothetical protein